MMAVMAWVIKTFRGRCLEFVHDSLPACDLKHFPTKQLDQAASNIRHFGVQKRQSSALVQF